MRDRGFDARAVVASLVVHLLLAWPLLNPPPREAPEPEPEREVARAVFEDVKLPPPPPPPPTPPPPEPEPVLEPAEEPPPEPPRKPPPRKLKPHPKAKPTPKPVERETPAPPTENPKPSADPNEEPVFGIDMNSGPGGNVVVPRGNTQLAGRDRKARPDKPPKPLGGGPPAPIDEVTKMPLPKGRCTARYTEEAKAAGVEGTVELELVVGADGMPRDVKVLEGLGHGLDQAAKKALQRCRFEPGRKGDEKVAVRIRSFKIRFFLDETN